MGRPSVAEMFPMRLLGLGLYFAWEALIVPFEKGWGVETFSSALGRFYLFTVVTVALLVGAAWAVRARGSSPWGVRTVAACGGCAVLVPLLDLVGLAVPVGGFAFDLAAIAARAVADAGLFLMWNQVLAGHKASVAWPAYAGSFAVAACVYFLVSAFGQWAVTAAVVALPVACCALLVAARALPRDDAAQDASVTWHFPWRPVVLMAAFSFTFFVAAHYVGDLQVGSELGRLAVAVAVLAVLAVAFDRCDIGVLYKVCPALMVAGLLLCCFVDGEDFGLRGFLTSAAYNGFTLYLFLTLNAVCFRFGAPSEWLFGITRAVCMVACVLASSLGNWLAEAPSTAVEVTMGACTVAVVLLSMLLMGDRKPVETWGIRATRVQEGVPEQPVAIDGYLENRVLRCALVARHFGLTHREEEVLSLLAQGLGFQQVEADLCIAHGTMCVHVQHIYAKLGVHSVEEAREAVERWRM